jgi:hypothetical protein
VSSTWCPLYIASESVLSCIIIPELVMYRMSASLTMVQSVHTSTSSQWAMMVCTNKRPDAIGIFTLGSLVLAHMFLCAMITDIAMGVLHLRLLGWMPTYFRYQSSIASAKPSSSFSYIPPSWHACSHPWTNRSFMLPTVLIDATILVIPFSCKSTS